MDHVVAKLLPTLSQAAHCRTSERDFRQLRKTFNLQRVRVASALLKCSNFFAISRPV